MKSTSTAAVALLGLLALAGLAGCQTTQDAVAAAPATTNATGKPETFAFQTEAMPAIHLGDGRGSISDVQRYPRKRTSSVSRSTAWSFDLKELPASGRVEIAIYSLTTEFSCVTALTLNGRQIADLAKFSPAGSGITTKAEMDIPGASFRVGTNRLEITEHECSGGGWNDSLVESASLRLSWGEG